MMRRTRAGTAQWVRCLLVGLLLGVVGCTPAGPGETPWQAEGTIQVIDGRTWVVGPHLVTLAPDAAVVGMPAVGAFAKLTGARGSRGQVVARQVEIAPAEQPPPPTVAPTRSEPTTRPTAQPTARPALQPTAEPTTRPSAEPATKPAIQPTAEPTTRPTAQPTARPALQPTAEPTTRPAAQPTPRPAIQSTAEPTRPAGPKPAAVPRRGQDDDDD
jgi:hypothetical protein